MTRSLDGIARTFDELTARLADDDVLADARLLRALASQRARAAATAIALMMRLVRWRCRTETENRKGVYKALQALQYRKRAPKR
jgi:hypothetical protein